jgi:hypothetical protein
MKIIKIAAMTVAILLAAVLGFAATRPDTFRVERTATIQASPGEIVPLLTDFHRWSSWSPYEKLDPGMKRTFSGASAGPGAVYEWDGNAKAGAGRMEILESSPSKVAIQIDFTAPMEGHNRAEFTLEPEGDATRVTWTMHGPSPYVAKVMGVFFNMDTMIGKDFETGLGNLKAIAER